MSLKSQSMFTYLDKIELFSGGEKFPFEGSTVLYPEWNIAALNHVPVSLSGEVQKAMYTIPVGGYEAGNGSYYKWQPTLSYNPLLDMVQVRFEPWA